MKEYFRPAIHLVDHFDSFVALAQSGVQEINLGPSSNQYADDVSGDSCYLQGDLQVSFNVAGIMPTSDGLLRITVSGDIRHEGEYYTIAFEGNDLSLTLGEYGEDTNPDLECDVQINHSYQISLSDLVAAAEDGVITVSAIPSSEVDCDCVSEDGGQLNSLTASLSFEGTMN